MQAVHLLLHQHYLLHLQVCLLQAKEDLSLLQHPVKVDRMFRLRTRGTHPGVEVLLGSLSLDVLGVMFHAHPLKSVLGSRQAFSTIQLPLSG
jgi:hypothetical protein